MSDNGKPEKHRLSLIEGHSESSIIKYEYRGVVITGTSNASSSSPYTRTRKWTTSSGLRAPSLKAVKQKINQSLDNQ